MKKDKVIILMEVLNPDSDIFFNDWKTNGYNASVIFKKVSKPIRAIRRYCLMNNIGDIKIWLGDWFNNLDKYESIIIHMNRLTRFLPELINKKNPNIIVIGWYWNTITKQSEPIKTNNPNIEYFSFDNNEEILEKEFDLPIFSNKPLISGWNMIMIAKNPQLINISEK